VTSIGATVANNYGADDLPAHDERYDRADEYVEVVDRLWASWDSDAVVCDRELSRFADPGKVHAIDFEGRWLRVRGPLTVPRSPQGRPVIMQAGGSNRGRDFAAKHAELIVTHRNTPAAMRVFREDIRERARSFGRDPDDVKVFFTLRPYIGETRAEARALRDYMRSRPTVNEEVGLAIFSSRTGVDFGAFPLDEPLPEKLTVAGSQSMVPQYTEAGQALTLRQIAMNEALQDGFSIEGTPADIANEMIDVMTEVGGDGIAVVGPLRPSAVSPFVDRVIPLLRSRVAVRTGYRHARFRENLQDAEFAPC
jgi:FMN-dependent oxidoreductase (nitrilotriacetate monooxygenase family)